ERDLYLLREGAAIDARIARVLPRMQTALTEERHAALVRRPHIDGLTPQEREVERLLRNVLEAPPESDDVADARPGDSLAWAKSPAATIRRVRGRYRGIPPAGLWGTLQPPGESVAPNADARAKKTNTRPNPLMSASDVGGAVDSSADAQQRVPDGR